MAGARYKLQFIIDQETFECFEKLRLGRFCATSRQHLLSTILKMWLQRTAQQGVESWKH